MSGPAAASPYAAVLDDMILRAEAACVRYRRLAEDEERRPLLTQNRREAWRVMEDTLMRLRAQRDGRPR